MLGFLYFESKAATDVELWVGESETLKVDVSTISPSFPYEHVHVKSYEWSTLSSSKQKYLSLETVGVANQRKVTLKKFYKDPITIYCTVTYYCSYISNGRQYTSSDNTRKYSFSIKCKTVDVTLYPTSKKLNVGQSFQLQYTFSPTTSTPEASVSFSSSNTGVATVDLNGKVTAVGIGTATITAKTNFETTATCVVTVSPITATSVSLNKSAISLKIGETQKLTATVTPSNASNKTVTWSSSNNTVAAVDENGNVMGKVAGKARITVKTNDGSNLSDYCDVTVGVLANSIGFNNSYLKKSIGDVFTLIPIFSPENTTNKTLEWASSNPEVASVDNSGNVTTYQVGTAKIIAKTTDGTNLEAFCDLTVIKQITSIELSEIKMNMLVNDYKIISATVLPTDATEQLLVWEASDPSVVRVENGIVIALKEGNSIIMVSSTDGSGVFAECEVIVGTLVESIELSDAELSLSVGAFKQITADVFPENATMKDIIWETSDSLVATVQNGLVLAHNEGCAIIKASATDTSGVFASCEVMVSDNSGIESVYTQIPNINIENNTILISRTKENEICKIYTIDGIEIYCGSDKSITLQNSGIYIVKIANKTFKVVI